MLCIKTTHFVVEFLHPAQGWLIRAQFADYDEARWFLRANPSAFRQRVRAA